MTGNFAPLPSLNGGEQPAEEQLAAWITQLKQDDALRPLPVEPSAVKTVFETQVAPDVVVKEFTCRDAAEAYAEEVESYPTLFEHLGYRFLAPAVYAACGLDSELPVYYTVQARQHGLHFKSVADEVIIGLNSRMSLNEYEALGMDGVQRAIGAVLCTRLNSSQLAGAQNEARILCERLIALEAAGWQLDDLDFFVDPDGQIQITDWELDTMKEARTHPATFLPCSQKVALLFALVDAV